MNRASKRKEQLAMARAYREKQKSAQTREATAWHEAAHAILMEYFDMEVRYVTCDPVIYLGKSYQGYCFPTASESELVEITVVTGIYVLMELAAGFVCEWIRGTMERGYVDPGDMEEMIEIAKQIDFPLKQEMKTTFENVENFLKVHWDVVEHLARQLIDRGRIEGSEVREIVRTRIGYVPEANQTSLFQGLVVEPGTEADTRESWMARAGQNVEAGNN